MASRILHLAVAQKIMDIVQIKDKNRFQLGCILPDAYNQNSSKADSHLKIYVCGNSKKTYDLERFIYLYGEQVASDELYLGYYLHLIQDLIFRKLIYETYQWNPLIPGNVQRLHNDYHLINDYIINKYNISCNIDIDIHIENEWKKEPIFDLYPFDIQRLSVDLKYDFEKVCDGDIFFFTKEMADEFIQSAVDVCVKEMIAINENQHYIDAYQYAWRNKGISLLKTTQNTRDLGGYKTRKGTMTKKYSMIRSDIQNSPCEEDLEFLKSHNITTIIDMRGQKDVDTLPSRFADVEGFQYFNCQIDEGSGIPESPDTVSKSYMTIATASQMPNVFHYIAASEAGVMFNCTAGKDRTGVVAAILLCHVGVSDEDIIENYVLTKEYGKERLELIHKNYLEIDMNIITPNKRFLKEFLELFRDEFGDTDRYFRAIGLTKDEIKEITRKLMITKRYIPCGRPVW